MKANELRIGNWYKSVKWNRSVQCELSDLYDLCAKSDGSYNDPPINEMFEPIPLTEEWLLKFGFEGNSIFGANIKYKIGYFEVWYFGEPDRYMLENLKNMRVYIEYVHQLQNLYFALTGTELLIKNKEI